MPPAHHVDFFDGVRLFDASNALLGFGGKGPKYEGILEACLAARRENAMSRADQIQFITGSDPANDGQKTWRDHVCRLDTRIVSVDAPFWETGITLPPVRPDEERPYRIVYSISATIAYQLGVLSARTSPSVVLATNCFELAVPVLDFISRANAAVILAFFRSQLDPRWEKNGYILRQNSPIKFFDLESHSRAILGMDLARNSTNDSRGSLRRPLPV